MLMITVINFSSSLEVSSANAKRIRSVIFFSCRSWIELPKGRQLLGPLQLIQVAATSLPSVQSPLCRSCCWKWNKTSRTFSWGRKWMQISQMVAASGQGLNCVVRTADLLCTEEWEHLWLSVAFVWKMSVCWMLLGLALVKIPCFHRPGLQRGSVPVLHCTWIYHAFVSWEVHF